MSRAQQLITENIATWTGAIQAKSTAGRGSSNKYELYGIKKLRELILELAVRGKLVPQDPNDEPASVLLERIAAEKAELVKAKKIKKPKALPPVSDEEKPFELPEGWEWVRLSDTGNIFNGNSINEKIKESKYGNVTKGLPFIATKDVSYGFEPLNYNNGTIIPHDEPKFKVAHKNSVLICSEGGSAGKKCGITDRDICFGNKLYANELHQGINAKYILSTYLSPTFFFCFSSSMTGIIGGIPLSKFLQLVVALPPEKEQQRIVQKVDELMALCDQLEQQTESSIQAHATLVDTLLATLANSADADELQQNWGRIAEHFDTLITTEDSLDSLLAAIFESAEKGVFIGRRDIPKQPLKNLLSFGPRNGFSPKEVDSPTNTKVLKLGATTTGRLLLEQSKNFDHEIPEDSHLWLSKGDILIQRGNSASYVGCNVLVEGDLEGYIYPDLMMKLRVKDNISAEYISIILSSPTCRKFMWDRMTGTSGTMPKISKKVVESIPIPLPSFEEQRKVVSIVKRLELLCENLKERLRQSQQTQVHLTDAIVEQALA